ncbi:MAG: chromosomal replication initiator protein DnaA [bacterium]
MSKPWNAQAWDECIARLNARIPAADIDKWVAPLQPVRRDDTLKLLAPNRYVLDHVNKNLRGLIEETLAAMDSGVQVVRIEIGGHGSDASDAPGDQHGAQHDADRRGNGVVAGAARAPAPYAGGVMNPNYTFETHIEGGSNQLARAAAMRVGASLGRSRSYNPLFIYGDVGLGKTHLMQAAGHLMLQSNPGTRVIYVRSELFVNDMVMALKNNAMDHFKRHYRSLGALLIDDIQFFARKTQSQEEFFHTFNTLLEGRQQIIITSDRTPKAIPDVDARLISRFSGGLTVGIEPPELETRVAILERKALEQGIELPHDVGFFIAGAIRSNVRELEGALHTVLASAGFTGRDIDVDLAREALRDRLAHQEQRTSIESIQQTVAEYYKLRVSDLLSKKRSRDISRPRQLAMYFAKEYTNLSLPQIGDRFGGRDHTTVLHACRKIAELIQTDAKMKEDQRNLQRLFGA